MVCGFRVFGLGFRSALFVDLRVSFGLIMFDWLALIGCFVGCFAWWLFGVLFDSLIA